MHSTVRNNLAQRPRRIVRLCDSASVEGDQSYLGTGPGGRPVVLKRVDEDCLLGSQLHPASRNAWPECANWPTGAWPICMASPAKGNSAWLIWEFVEGKTFDEYFADDRRTPVDLLNVARELILAVDALHGQGIVHGALVGANVIITPEGALRLIHVSPLLYTDMDVDVECVVSLLQEAVERRGEQDSRLGRLLTAAGYEGLSLRGLATKIAALLEVRVETNLPEARAQERHIRRRTFLAAGVVGLLGLVLAYGIWRVTDGSAEFHPAHWLMPSSTPDK